VKSPNIDHGIVWRLSTAIVLALAALALFLLHGTQKTGVSFPAEQEARPLMVQVDREIDTILARLKIQKEWIRKSEVAISGTTLTRTERKIMIPPDLLPVQVNLALSTMARKYNGRAIASENSRENSVSIHLEFRGMIMETVILKPDPRLKRSTPGEPSTTI